jgi:hypothetical protein
LEGNGRERVWGVEGGARFLSGLNVCMGFDAVFEGGLEWVLPGRRICLYAPLIQIFHSQDTRGSQVKSNRYLVWPLLNILDSFARIF